MHVYEKLLGEKDCKMLIIRFNIAINYVITIFIKYAKHELEDEEKNC